MSDIGILSSPEDLIFIFVFLGWPALLAGAIIGGFVGLVVRRHRQPMLGTILGAFVGLLIGAAGFAIWANWWM